MDRIPARCNCGLRTAAMMAIALLTLSATSPSSAKSVAVHLFDLNGSASYTVLKNGSPLGSVNTTAAGVLRTVVDADAGDEIRFVDTGSGALPPSTPTGLAAVGDDVGCAHLSWNANPESDLLGYRIYFGVASAAYDDSVDVDAAETTYDRCALADGTWFFALRARNAAGLLSGLSVEASASVSNGNAQPPSPPPLVAASQGQPGCLSVSWIPLGDPTVVGYVVDYGLTSVAGGGAAEYDESVDVGPVTSTSLCSLPTGTYYVAVRSRNHLGMLSAYSVEETVELTSTPVLISHFDGRVDGQSVRLEWEIYADEELLGFRVVRDLSDAPGNEVTVSVPDLLPTGNDHFVDRTIAGDTRYDYTLVVVDVDGRETRSAPVTVRTNPVELFLEQNFPNPFNPTTSISFVLPAAGHVQLTVHDVRGRLVATLASEEMSHGRAQIDWDGTDDSGNSVASGTYFYRLESPGGVRARKMVLLK